MANGTIGLGQFHGKMGGMVMRVVNGKQVMQMYQPIVRNPDTEAQRAQRDGMRVLGKIGGTSKNLLAKTYYGRYPMAQFIGRAIKRTSNALNLTQGALVEPNWPSMPWGKGDGETTITVSALGQLTVGNHLTLNFTGGIMTGLPNAQMEKVIIAYCSDLDEVMFNDTALPSAEGGSIIVPARWDGMNAHVWVVGKGYLETPATEAINQEAKRLPFVTTNAKYVGEIEVS